jgi:ketosteroid isomerase-like protein
VVSEGRGIRHSAPRIAIRIVEDSMFMLPRRLWPAALLLLIALPGASARTETPPAPEAAGHSALDSLVAAERGFSALSVEKGMRDAFLRFLADDGIIFRPLPVNGKDVWRARGPVAGTLVWEPEYAEVSAAGDLGYTTGPWEFRAAPERNLPAGHGHFVSVWKKQAAGEWRVAADIGVTHEKPGRAVEAFGPGRGPTLHPSGGRVHGRADLAALDQALSRATRSKGIRGAFAARASADVRFNTEGALPVLGAEAARAALDTLAGSLRLVAQSGGLAASGDLGYSFGLAERFATSASKTPADSSVYLHVWRRAPGGKWKLALAVWNPLRRE